eukprot:TRINITY_DN4900_c0_g1_i2.p1 TRINITY_DN4900_c0_g1~~TRINITY_DN4900_c0_g1_i2.p1  ORF type:complete len:181 (+),score=9.57 TRINITY_DN4900_c0_g1_i2:177-719(+)
MYFCHLLPCLLLPAPDDSSRGVIISFADLCQVSVDHTAVFQCYSFLQQSLEAYCTLSLSLQVLPEGVTPQTQEASYTFFLDHLVQVLYDIVCQLPDLKLLHTTALEQNWIAGLSELLSAETMSDECRPGHSEIILTSLLILDHIFQQKTTLFFEDFVESVSPDVFNSRLQCTSETQATAH